MLCANEGIQERVMTEVLTLRKLDASHIEFVLQTYDRPMTQGSLPNGLYGTWQTVFLFFNLTPKGDASLTD